MTKENGIMFIKDREITISESKVHYLIEKAFSTSHDICTGYDIQVLSDSLYDLFGEVFDEE